MVDPKVLPGVPKTPSPDTIKPFKKSLVDRFFGPDALVNTGYRFVAIGIGIPGYVYSLIYNTQAGTTISSGLITLAFLG